jgi:hypothetical protein
VYQIPELDFDYLVQLDLNGVEPKNLGGIAGLNVFVAYVTGVDAKEASKLISTHIMNDGKMEELFDVYNNALTESGFFRKVLELDEENETEQTETPEENPKKKS